MKRTISLMLAALLLFCTMMPAMAAENQDVQEISGQVLASELRDDATIKLTGDTVLTLDTDKSIVEINDPGENGHSLTIEGTATLTVKIGINEDRIILNSGKINLSDAYQIPCVSANFITINGGELYINSGSSGLDVREELNISGGKLEIHTGYVGIGANVMNVSGGEVYTSGYFVAIGGFGSWSGMISGCKLNVTGGYVKATAIKTLVVS